MKLSNETLKILKDRESLHLRNRLALIMGRHQDTILRWINDNDVMLTTAQALQIIREETGLTDEQILTDETTAA